MYKYCWHQRYAFERFDLEGPMSRLVGWIVGNPDKTVTAFYTMNDLGYNTCYSVRSNSGEKVNWTWKIWWAERDERGYFLAESSTDGVTYSKMDDAKIALQARFGINPEEVTTSKWAGNLTEY